MITAININCVNIIWTPLHIYSCHKHSSSSSLSSATSSSAPTLRWIMNIRRRWTTNARHRLCVLACIHTVCCNKQREREFRTPLYLCWIHTRRVGDHQRRDSLASWVQQQQNKQNTLLNRQRENWANHNRLASFHRVWEREAMLREQKIYRRFFFLWIYFNVRDACRRVSDPSNKQRLWHGISHHTSGVNWFHTRSERVVNEMRCCKFVVIVFRAKTAALFRELDDYRDTRQ